MAAEHQLRASGAPRIAISIAGPEGAAHRLCERLGFATTAQQRARLLTEIPDPAGVRLVPLTDPGRRLGALLDEYALDLQEDEHLTAPEARRAAERRLAAIDPEQPHTRMCTVTSRDEEVGWTWTGPPRTRNPGLGWLHQIAIDPAYQGRGLGARALAAVQRGLRDAGLRSLGLDVHGANGRARRLYDRQGFALTAQQMVKDLR